jgi:hydroxypyruvate isomerase
MLRYAANISLMFNEWSFADRFEAAATAGFKAVEFMPPVDLAPERLAGLLQRNQLTQALANVPLAAGSKGLAAVPGQQLQFRADFAVGLAYATAANASLLHVTTGVVAAADYDQAATVFRENLSWAMDKAGEVGIKLVVEAINQHAVPGYFVRSLADAYKWTLKHPGLGLLLDLYHAAKEGLDPHAALSAYMPMASHIQLAAVTGRHEPDPTDLPFCAILGDIRSAPYAGWTGCEYVPERGTLEGLGWMRTAAAASNG